MKGVKIGMVGCGSMGMSLARKLVGLDERLQVAAVFDPDPRSIEKVREAWGEAPKVCDRYEAVLAQPDVDWVMIASWNCFHCEQVVAAFEAGKHVFCQKPLALTLDECLRMHRAWKQSGTMFNIGFTLRYSPHYRALKQMLSDGAVGRILSMEFNETLDFNHGGYIMGDWRRLRKNAGTHLLEKCCHDIDLINWFLESRACRVASFGGLDFFTPENAGRAEALGALDDGRRAYRTWGGLVDLDPFHSDKDIVDNQVAILEYANGVRATFHTNGHAAIPERRMYILGTEGAIRADVLTGTIQHKRIDFSKEIDEVSSSARGGHGGGDAVLARELADSMTAHVPPAVGLIEGIESAVTCFAVDEAMDTGTVVDVDTYWRRIDARDSTKPAT